MQRFHRALVGGLPPAQALQQAIVALQGMDLAARDSDLAALRTAAAASPLPDRTQGRRFGSARAIPRDDARQPFHWAPFILAG